MLNPKPRTIHNDANKHTNSVHTSDGMEQQPWSLIVCHSRVRRYKTTPTSIDIDCAHSSSKTYSNHRRAPSRCDRTSYLVNISSANKGKRNVRKSGKSLCRTIVAIDLGSSGWNHRNWSFRSTSVRINIRLNWLLIAISTTPFHGYNSTKQLFSKGVQKAISPHGLCLQR